VTTTAQEGDFLESTEGLIFDVKGSCHPPNRIISYVRYIPDPKGDRKRGKKSYRKIYNLEERHQFLKEKFPSYLYFDPVFQRELQGVPLESITKVYHPKEKLAELCTAHRDTLEECAVQLAQSLDIPVETMGISGSILVGLHTVDSDIDVIVYKEASCIQVYHQLQKLSEQGVVQQFDTEKAQKKAQFRWGSQNESLVTLEQKKVMHGLFKGKEYFFRFLKSEYKKYGDIQYIPLHKATLKAVIKDDTESIFTPCRYLIEDSSIESIEQLVSLRGRFCEQAQKGDSITARGTIEKVVSKTKEYYQMMLGDAGDYLLPKRSIQ